MTRNIKPRGFTEIFATALLVCGLFLGCTNDERPRNEARPAADAPLAPPLVTGHALSPDFSESSQDVGSLPVNMIASPDGKFAITTDGGIRQSLWSVRLSDGAGVGHLDFPRSPLNGDKYGLYYGLAIATDGTLYAAQGNNDSVAVLKLSDDGALTRLHTIKTRAADFPAGLALDTHGHLYVANNDPVSAPAATGGFLTPGSIAIYDTASGTEIGRFAFTQSFGGTPNFPLALAVKEDGSKVYVGSQRDSAVYVLDTARPSEPVLRTTLATGSHPIALCFNKTQSRLFVANAQSDTISVIDTAADRIISTILLRPEIARDVAGATPTGLALAPDEKTLYATLGDMNAVAVISIEKSELLGYLPAGWYPSSLLAMPDGKHLLVANAKGVVARHPNPPADHKDPRKPQSPLTQLEGTVTRIEIPADSRAATEKVLENNRLTPRFVNRENPLKSIGLSAGAITHVIYIVKENRTYDQVLGDLPQGNGDPVRCIFGREVTPNQHALAERFVLLDNFYDCGEVSGDGWPWSTQAHANEYVIRNVPYSYSSRGRSFDYEGQINDYPTGGFPAKGPDGKPLSEHPAYKNGAPAVPDVAEAPGGHIWDLARKAGLTYRNYGFFMSDGVKENGTSIIPDNFPNAAGLQPGGHDLAGVTDVDYRRFDLAYADSDLPSLYAEETKDNHYLRPRREFGVHHAGSRFAEWNAEFRQMLAKAPDGSGVPNLMTLRVPVDHTMGMNAGKHTPRSMVADNDYAVGQIVEAVSTSPIWKHCAIFIIEDDAQNGPDHVDAHRSTCFVISPWIKRQSVDHTFQNTVSCIRTMELLLGLPPMCQYDATAAAILDWDTAPNNAEPYHPIRPDKKFLREINGETNGSQPVSPEQRTWIEKSEKMDFAHADRAPADVLNEIIWKSVRGMESSLPATPRGPSPLTGPKKDDDD